MADGDVYGTADPDEPVSRADFERALRHLNLSDVDLRDAVLQIAGRLVALTDELTRRLDGVEPEPAAPGTPAAVPTGTIEAAVNEGVDAAILNVRAGDAAQPTRVSLDLVGDKYTTEPSSPPCDELLHLCEARCCTLTFALSTQDLDEGVIRWDYGQPYLIRQRQSDGYCVHNHPASHTCTVHAQRPRVCRSYDCRNDVRIWKSYEDRIPAEPFAGVYKADGGDFDLVERARERQRAYVMEKTSISETFADAVAQPGPPAKPQTSRVKRDA
jgi:Fe-S-cluster containining protein